MKIFFTFFFLLCLYAASAQEYKILLDSGKIYYQRNEYYEAYKRFNAAKVYGKTLASIVKQSEEWMQKAVQGIEHQKIVADSLVKITEREKAKSDSTLKVAKIALALADTMQRKVETAMFDKAVKERKEGKEWKGYDKYEWDREDKGETKKGLEILQKIDSLNLAENALLRIPREVVQCPNLKHINLLGNKDINWKSSEITLSKLNAQTGIYISVYDLSDIDSTYWHLVSGIKILKNELTKFPKNILKLKLLTFLDLGYNGLDTLPPEIGKLINLTSLDLKCNKLTTLPVEIGNLQNLKSLDLYMNDLTTLLPEIGNLKNLISLNLGVNQITTLPLEIKNLIKSTNLDLYNNKLTTLPPEIGKLRNLTSLNLAGNQLTTLPPEIGNLKNLTSLFLWVNQLTSLPSEIGNLKNLTSLYLEKNMLTTLPSEIGKLINLTSLDLSGNDNISIVSVCYAFANFPKKINITTYEYASNFDNSIFLIKIPRLTNLPSEIGNLKNLTSLHLYNNQLSTLPLEFVKLSKLESLDVLGNPISDLPEEVVNMPILKWKTSDIENCAKNKTYAFAIKIRKAIMKQPDFEYIDDYANLAWWCVIANDLEGAIWAGKKYIEKGGTEINLISNLGLGYLFYGNLAEAKQLYTKYKNEPYKEGKGKDGFLDDIDAVLAAGIKPKNEKDIDVIKKLLNE